MPFPGEPTRVEQLIVRTDKGDGSQGLVEWDYAYDKISSAYNDVEPVMKQLALGHPIGTMFAIYQHRDFVEGFERP